MGVEPLSLTCLFGNSELPLFDLLLFFLDCGIFLEKKEQAVCRKEKKRSKVCMRWILESEENGEDLERIGKDRKIGITNFIDSVGDNLSPTHT